MSTQTPNLPSQSLIDKELIRRGGLRAFSKWAWPLVEPSNELYWNWHLDVLCEYTEALFKGDIKRLLINIPPGTMKSLVCSVFAPAWLWTFAPAKRMLFASYSQSLSLRDSIRTRRIISSQAYQECWGDKFTLVEDQNTKTNFENSATGFRYATSVGGTVTGNRGDLVVCDDLINVKKADSEAYRKDVHNFFWEVLPSRVNDLRTGLFLVIMQRSHSEDTAGEILAKDTGEFASDNWVHVNLPLEYEKPKFRIDMIDKRTKEGEILHEERFPPNVIAKLKNDLGSYAYAGQYQQRPVPREGGLIKERWLSNRFNCEMSPESLMKRNPIMVMQSADCASKPKESNDPTVIITAAIFSDRIELWDVKKKRMEFPEAQRLFRDLTIKWSPNGMLIEDKDSGQQHIQQLRADQNFKVPIKAILPETDKFTRMAAETPFIEAGQLWLPSEAEWVADYVTELCLFNLGAAHDDQVDATSQLLKWYRDKFKTTILVGPNAEEMSQSSEHEYELKE